LTGTPLGADVRPLGGRGRNHGHDPRRAGRAERRAGGRGVEAESGGPYVTAVSVTAEPEANLIDQTPAAAPARWIKPIACYERRQRHEFACARYG
jgi:hypothetical protein